MRRYYKSLLSFLLSAVIVMCSLLPAINVYASDNLTYSTLTLVPDGEVSETGYLSEKWVDESGADAMISDPEKTEKPVPNNGTPMPSSYSAVDLGYVTKIKDQKSTNSCWAFSAVAAAESSLLKQGLATTSDAVSDLSEAHLVWFTHKSLTTDVDDPTFGDGTNEGSPYTKGGYWLRSTYSLARGAGFALEKDYPFYADNTSMMGDYAESSRYESKVTLDEAYLIPNEETNEIKKAIIENGSITAAAFVVNSYLNKGSDGYAYYQNYSASATNHQMIFVGWDDNFSVDNFSSECRPTNPGAWLVKNSYGTSYGDNGYFWISYEDPSLDQFAVEKVSLTNENEKIYQYDGYGYSKGIGSRYEDENKTPVYTAKQANVFTSETNEMLSSVSFYTLQNDVSYTIEVYNNVTAGLDNPISGGTKSVVVTEGVASFKGYHKIPLDRNIPVSAGENFSIVVTLSIKDGDVPLYVPFEGQSGISDGVYVRYSTSEIGQSYYKYGEDTWHESSGNDNLNNVCVKAFTVPDNSLEIRTAEEFNAFAKSVAEGNAYEGKNINLVSDIDFDGGSITPVGTEQNPFCGYFLGNGFVLKNGVIDSESDIVGVFSKISADSSIRKLGVENVSVTGVYGVGGLCGQSDGLLIYCYSTGTVSGEESAGGLVGINNGTISHSYSIAEVTGDYNAGSLVGESNSGIYELCVVSSSSTLNPIGNEDGDVRPLPEKSFLNGQAAFYLDEGSTARKNVWTKKNGVTTFAKSAEEYIYQIELYAPANYSSLYLYACPNDDLSSMAEEAKPGLSVSIFADPKCAVPFTGVPQSNMILYVVWEESHSCAKELTFHEGKPADCYNAGRKSYYECSCGKQYADENAETEIDSLVIAPLSHPAESVVKTEAVKATHITDGNIEYYTCSLCGDVFSDSECTILTETVSVPALGHSHGGWITEKEATCEETGFRYKACSCGDKIEEVIPATGHSYEITVIPPTVDEKGSITYTCNSCGFSYISEYVDVVTTVSFNASVTSYLSDDDEIMIELIEYGSESVSYSAVIKGNNAEVSFDKVLSGVYTIKISKNNHAVRVYEEIIVKENGVYEFKICPIGDINGDGKISIGDYTKVLRHTQKIQLMDGYEFACADIDSNGKVTVADYGKILKHVNKTQSIW